MAFWLAGEINLDVVSVQLQKILSPYTVLFTDDIGSLPNSAWRIDVLFSVWGQPSQRQQWTCFELVKSSNQAFEIEEYVAYQLNQQYGYVTVAECYRLMHPSIRQTPTSSYYSILFDEHHRVILVANDETHQEVVGAAQEEKLDFVPLAYLDAKPDDQCLSYHYQTGVVDEVLYLGKRVDDQFYPMIQANYQALSWSDIGEF